MSSSFTPVHVYTHAHVLVRSRSCALMHVVSRVLSHSLACPSALSRVLTRLLAHLSLSLSLSLSRSLCHSVVLLHPPSCCLSLSVPLLRTLARANSLTGTPLLPLSLSLSLPLFLSLPFSLSLSLSCSRPLAHRFTSSLFFPFVGILLLVRSLSLLCPRSHDG